MINAAYDAICLIPLSVVPTVWITSVLYPDAPVAILFIISVLITATGLAFLHLENGGRIIIGGTVISVAAVSLMIIPAGIRTEFFAGHRWILTCLIICAVSFFAGAFLIRFSIMRIILAAGSVITLAVAMFFHVSPNKPVVCLIFFFAGCMAADTVQLWWKKSVESSHKAHLVYISPFLLLFLILMAVFPSSDEPYDWAFAKRIYETASDRLDRVKEYFSYIKSSDDGADLFMGFSESAFLGTDNKSNRKKIMEVMPYAQEGSVVYLAGKTFDSFDGRDWSKNYDADTDDTLTDCVETVYSVAEYYEDPFSDLLKNTSVRISLLNLHTSHVFAPDKVTRIDTDGISPEIEISGGDILFSERLSYGDSYTVSHIRTNSASREYTDFLSYDHTDDEERWNTAVSMVDKEDKYGLTYEDLPEYRERMKSIYLSPVVFSPELSAYMDDLLSGCESDAEKLSRIDEMLSSMKYNGNPAALPEGVDSAESFLDHFMFESQEGYCVYFATAFVLMARGEGIPARFVQGYRVPIKHGTDNIVTENLAHAWPECYLEGVGWVAYEPTPGYSLSKGWKTAAELAGEKDLKAGYEEEENEEDVVLPEKAEEDSADGRHAGIRYLIIILAVSLLTAGILFAGNIIFGNLRYRLMDDEHKFMILFRRNLSLLSILGYRRDENETFEEFIKRASEKIPSELCSFLQIYEAFIYRGDPVTAGDVALLTETNSGLLEYIKKHSHGYRAALLGYYLFGQMYAKKS